MLKISPYRGFLLVFLLLVAGVLAAAASVLLKRDPVAWRATAVDVSGSASGGVRLDVAGEGLPGGLRAVLLPNRDSDAALESGMISVPLYRFATDGRLAVASTRDHRLLTLDVTPGRQPEVIGGLKLPFPEQMPGIRGINGLVLIGARVLVVSSEGLYLIDVANPELPRLIESYKLRERLLDVQAGNDVVYLVSDVLGLVTVTFGGDKIVVGRVPGSPPATRLALDQGRLVTAGPKGDLTLYQLDSRGQPVLVGKAAAGKGLRDLVVTPKALYVAAASGHLLTFALDSWPRLSPGGKLPLNGHPLRLEWMTAKQALLCAMVSGGPAVIDVKDAVVPQLVGTLPLPGMPQSITPSGERAFMAGVSGVSVFSSAELFTLVAAKNGESPLLSPGPGTSLLLWDSAVFAYSRKDLHLLAAGSPGEGVRSAEGAENGPFLFLPDERGVRFHALREGVPTKDVAGRIPISDAARERSGMEHDLVKKVFWRDGRLYVLSPSKVSILEISAAGQPSPVIHEVPLQGSAVDMAWLSPGFLVLATADAGFAVVDIRQPGTPRVIGGHPLPRHQQVVGALKNLLVDGSRLYVSRARLGVEIFDLSDPAAPRLLQRIDTPGYANDLYLHDGLLLVNDSDQGVFVIDVSGEVAVAAGDYQLPKPAHSILYDGVALYMVSGSGEVYRLPPPLRVAGVAAVSDTRASLLLPGGVAPGCYQLALYDQKSAVNLPVTLP